MNKDEWLAERFEENRTRLRAVAYRMLGSLSDADDAVQESWLRLSRSTASDIENLSGWLTTVVARVCLNMLRSRNARREEPLDVHLPDPIISRGDAMHPEQAALLADAIGLALFVVLDSLGPNERLAFVLHDMFAVPFDEIAAIVGCSPEAARQLASRARRRVKGSASVPDGSLTRQREVVDAFLAAARAGDFDALLAVLDPDVVRHADHPVEAAGRMRVVRGAHAVAESVMEVARFLAEYARPAIVNGAAGLVMLDPTGRLRTVIGFTITQGKIVELDVFVDPARLGRLDVSGLNA
jgi:RNA polymerase sigma-70 factor (ECF subfamily)